MAHGTLGTQEDRGRAVHAAPPDSVGLTLALGSSVDQAIDFITHSLSNHNHILITAGLS